MAAQAPVRKTFSNSKIDFLFQIKLTERSSASYVSRNARESGAKRKFRLRHERDMHHNLREQFSPISNHDEGERYADESEEDAEDLSQISGGHNVSISCQANSRRFKRHNKNYRRFLCASKTSNCFNILRN